MKRHVLGIFMVAVGMVCRAAWAGGITGAGSIAESGSGGVSHAWFVDADLVAGRATLFHLPPRTRATSTGRGSRAGEARVAYLLPSVPDAIAARGNRLALLFSSTPNGMPMLHGRTILTLGAVESDPGIWKTIPDSPVGGITTRAPRLDALPVLRDDGVVLGFVGAEVGYAALLQGLSADRADPTKLELEVLVGGTWMKAALPPAAESIAAAHFMVQNGKPGVTAVYRLIATDDGVALFIIPPRATGSALAGSCFLGDFRSSPEEGPPAAVWTQRDFSIPVAGSVSSAMVQAAYAADCLLLAVPREGDTLAILSQPLRTPSAWREIAQVPRGSDWGITPLDDPGRLAVFSTAAPKTPGREPTVRLTEISARTGASLYSGDVLISSPISDSDYRLLGVLFAWVAGLVVLFVIRPPTREGLSVPEGHSLAEPGRRMLAGTIDFALALAVSCKMLGVPFSEAFTLSIWDSPAAQNVLLLAAAVLIIACTLLETIVGRTPGKLLTGCGVASLLPPGKAEEGKKDERTFMTPTLGRSFLRNAVKWGLPPVAVFGMLSPGGRHRGDQVALAAVVIEVPEEEEEEG